MELKTFIENPFIKTIAGNEKWTIVDKNKRPIDIRRLLNEQIIVGASFKDGNKPLVTLDKLLEDIPDAANATYLVNQMTDNFVVLDIEPKCPPEIRDNLLRLPYLYCEISMSGYGFHLVFEKPKTKFQDIILAKPVVRHKSGWYEFLLNHYATFTGNICLPSQEALNNRLPESEILKVFDELAENTKLNLTASIDTSELPDPDEIPKYERIMKLLMGIKYGKTIEDFPDEAHDNKEYDYSRYEFGVMGFYNTKLKMLLETSAYKDHEYTPQERMVILYNVVTNVIPYREKHDTIHDGLPFLMYSCRRVITSIPNK